MDLATYPQYIEPLRQEIEYIIEQEWLTQDDNGQYKVSKNSITKLKKLDSFIKES